ncbi:MAG: GIY-YIG nuclease family protein [Clostridia bacterium]|nr:GIY-YIG nuclease family protein [Clostridia bacterium]MBQ6722434.1 GIY-YIG nuclease family protein [Clostridia bacterium]
MSDTEKTEKGKNILPVGFRQGVCCTYLLQCADGSLYCGWTNDLEHRLQSHNAGTGGKYTRSRRPVRLMYAERFGTKEEAMRREWEIKRLTRKAKIGLIQHAGGNGEKEGILRIPDEDGYIPAAVLSGEAERLK